MSNTKIEWTDETWNPVTGCTKVSPGCANCYIEDTIPFRIQHRKFRRVGNEERIDLRFHPERLNQPLKWKRPRRVFVNSMSDLFHENVPELFILEVFLIMAMSPEHTYQILTKRPERMQAVIESIQSPLGEKFHAEIGKRTFAPDMWPLANVWLGVSVENQYWADERIPLLLKTPAAVRFISYEPALKQVDFSKWLPMIGSRCYDGGYCHHECVSECWREANCGPLSEPEPYLDQIIVGGESGSKARPCEDGIEVAIRSTIEQCKAANVSVFVKQLGSVWAREHADRISKGGDMKKWPEDLRIREFPVVRTAIDQEV